MIKSENRNSFALTLNYLLKNICLCLQKEISHLINSIGKYVHLLLSCIHFFHINICINTNEKVEQGTSGREGAENGFSFSQNCHKESRKRPCTHGLPVSITTDHLTDVNGLNQRSDSKNHHHCETKVTTALAVRCQVQLSQIAQCGLRAKFSDVHPCTE